MTASGTISFIEIGSADGEAIRSFFSAVFGWSSHDNAWLQTPTIRAGTHGEDPTPQIYVYFHAADLEAAAQNVRAAGGEAAEVVEEPGFGRFVNCRDRVAFSSGFTKWLANHHLFTWPRPVGAPAPALLAFVRARLTCGSPHPHGTP